VTRPTTTYFNKRYFNKRYASVLLACALLVPLAEKSCSGAPKDKPEHVISKFYRPRGKYTTECWGIVYEHPYKSPPATAKACVTHQKWLTYHKGDVYP